MPCHAVQIKNGTVGIICTGRQPVKRCDSCGRPSTVQCDYQVIRRGRSASCDRYLCGVCSVPMGVNVDYCRTHHAMSQQTPAEMGMLF